MKCTLLGSLALLLVCASSSPLPSQEQPTDSTPRFEKAPPAAARPRGKEAPLSGPAFEVSDTVSAAKIISTTDAEYTKAPRKAHVEGNVVLSLVIDIDGHPKDVKVVRALGSGLDNTAIDSVRGWRFTPERKDAQPVPVRINVEVGFRLY